MVAGMHSEAFGMPLERLWNAFESFRKRSEAFGVPLERF